MRRSKLEMYVDTLMVLAHQGPLRLTHLMYKTNVNCSVLKEYLGKRRIVYAITQKGITVLKHFRELKQVLPIEEEDQKSVPPLF
jgi:predicted transcriptional regulator